MKKILSLLLFAHTIFGHSEAHPVFYGDLHFMGGLPMVGMGVRAKSGIHAFDLSGSTCIFNPPPRNLKIFHLKSLYLSYPNQTGFYFGGGLGLLNELELLHVSGSGEGAIGYQWKNGLFLEGNVIVPFKQSKKLAPVWPGLTLGFGF